MAARKTNAVYVVDAGLSMGGRISGGTESGGARRIDLAIAAIIAQATQKLTASKMFENGVCVYGRGITSNSLALENDGFYENVEELISLGRTSLEDMRKIKAVDVGEKQGDMIDALVVSYNCLKNFNPGKTQNKGIFIRYKCFFFLN